MKGIYPYKSSHRNAPKIKVKGGESWLGINMAEGDKILVKNQCFEDP